MEGWVSMLRHGIDLGDQPFKCNLLTPESKKKKNQSADKYSDSMASSSDLHPLSSAWLFLSYL